jgi:outer membrane cobalamin receptor
MWFCYRAFLVAVLGVSAFASDLAVQVVDPQSAAVAGARVEVYQKPSKRPVAIDTTSAQGVAHFNQIPGTEFRIHVLAPGFKEQWQDVSSDSREKGPITVPLEVAVASETVVVSATRTPVSSGESGAAVDQLSAAQLDTMRPVAAADALRFLPGAIVSTSGQRGGLASLFVRGGESRYNKVIVDGVPINDPGGTYDFGTLPLDQADRLEFLRGTESTLYGSDAMSSVVQVWSQTGRTAIPELRFGSDAGNYGTENGYGSLSGAHGPFDYNLFANQFNTSGSGPNDDYTNSLEGANLGVKWNDWASLRLRLRHDNSASGVENEWNFNGNKILPPDRDQRAEQNNLLSSLQLDISRPSGWHHRFSGFDHVLDRTNIDTVNDQHIPGLDPDFQFHAIADINRAGFEYEGSCAERSWAQSTFGYLVEDENGFVGDVNSGITHGQRLTSDVYAQQQLLLGRLALVAGARFVHNSAFGNTGVPQVNASYLALRGGQVLSGTRLVFSYGKGFKEPRLEETYAGPPTSLPNPALKPERVRSFQAGFEQRLFVDRMAFTATYFHSLFHDQIAYPFDPTTFVGQYQNINQSLAHGAEVQLETRVRSELSLITAYTYTATQILEAPACTLAQFCDVTTFGDGKPLLHRPRHSANLLLTYLGHKWGGALGGSFVGRRADSDFYGLGYDHAPGYVLLNAGGWYALTSRVRIYANGENLLDRFYEENVGYPALGINFRAGMQFRIGGE